MTGRYLRDAWTATTKPGKDAGSVNIGNIGATEDAARRRFAAVAGSGQARERRRPVI
jgi:hypothetical protein